MHAFQELILQADWPARCRAHVVQYNQVTDALTEATSSVDIRNLQEQRQTSFIAMFGAAAIASWQQDTFKQRDAFAKQFGF